MHLVLKLPLFFFTLVTLKDLDKVTGDVPTIIWQRSTHEIYLNTACAKKYGVKKGKQATFTLLEQNPFKIEPVKIKDIPVAGVVYKGRMVLNKGKLAGGDRDAHGCIGSAGYSWCTSTKQCERPWELARKHGFANTREAFDTFCENQAKLN